MGLQLHLLRVGLSHSFGIRLHCPREQSVSLFVPRSLLPYRILKDWSRYLISLLSLSTDWIYCFLSESLLTPTLPYRSQSNLVHTLNDKNPSQLLVQAVNSSFSSASSGVPLHNLKDEDYYLAVLDSKRDVRHFEDVELTKLTTSNFSLLIRYLRFSRGIQSVDLWLSARTPHLPLVPVSRYIIDVQGLSWILMYVTSSCCGASAL